jgi:DNA-binding beta-propeller fold protein YncE
MKVIFRLFAVLMAIALVGCGSSPLTVQIGLVYIVGQGTNTIQGFSQQSDGELQSLPLSSFGTNPRPVSLAFTPAKDFLYVANISANTVSGYAVNHTTGVLTPVGQALAPTPVGVQPISVGVDPSGHFLYVLNQGSTTAASSISAFTIDSRGLLTTVSGSPFPVAASPQYMLVSPASELVYVVSGSPSSISVFGIATSGGLVASPASSFAGPANANITSIAVDPKGQFMYATDVGNNNVISLSIAPGTSALTPVAGSPFTAGTGPNAVAVDGTGSFVYVSNKGSNDVSAFKSTAGVLAQVTGSPFTTLGSGTVAPTAPGFLTVDAGSTFLYVSNTATNAVASFLINSDGTLGNITNSPFGQSVSPLWIVSSK